MSVGDTEWGHVENQMFSRSKKNHTRFCFSCGHVILCSDLRVGDGTTNVCA